MKISIMSILFLLFLPIFSVAQKQSLAGFYQARFYDVRGTPSIVHVEFEIRENNSIKGKATLGGLTLDFDGTVDEKGEFQMTRPPYKDVNVIIRGNLPVSGKEGKVYFIQRQREKGSNGKRVSEATLNGCVEKVSSPVELKDVGIVDDGKTRLSFKLNNSVFDSDWNDFPATLKITGTGGETALEVEMNSLEDSQERRLRVRLVMQKEDQKVWNGREISNASYSEGKKSADGVETHNLFIGANNGILGGKIETVGDNEKEMIFKISNLQIKRFTKPDSVTINGYIHAAKSL